MFRLIKLAVYTLIGYAIYEFIRGVTDMTSSSGGQQGGGGETGGQDGQSKQSNPAMAASGPTLGQDPQSHTPLMGGSESPQGIQVPTQDFDGGSVTQTVGRGVVHR